MKKRIITRGLLHENRPRVIHENRPRVIIDGERASKRAPAKAGLKRKPPFPFPGTPFPFRLSPFIIQIYLQLREKKYTGNIQGRFWCKRPCVKKDHYMGTVTQEPSPCNGVNVPANPIGNLYTGCKKGTGCYVGTVTEEPSPCIPTRTVPVSVTVSIGLLFTGH